MPGFSDFTTLFPRHKGNSLAVQIPLLTGPDPGVLASVHLDTESFWTAASGSTFELDSVPL